MRNFTQNHLFSGKSCFYCKNREFRKIMQNHPKHYLFCFKKMVGKYHIIQVFAPCAQNTKIWWFLPNFMKFGDFLEILHISKKFSPFCEKCDFCEKWPPESLKKHWFRCCFRTRAKKETHFPKFLDFHEILETSWNFMIFMKFHDFHGFSRFWRPGAPWLASL